MSTFLSFLLAIFGAFKPLVYAVIYWVAKKAGRQEAEHESLKTHAARVEKARAARRAAELEYDNSLRTRPPDDGDRH